MNWAQRRRLGYIAIVMAFFAIIAFLIFHKITDVAPTCFDHKQNQGEVGIDCGGPCNNYCAYQLNDPVVEWVRVFPVTPGIVDAVAYVKDSYPLASAPQIGYEFKLYDAKNNVLADRTGTTFLGPAGTTAIVETLIKIGNNTPVSLARFSFDDPIAWQKVSPAFSQVVINTDNNTTKPFSYGAVGQVGTRLTAVLQNQSRYSFTDLDVAAIFYDKDGNALTASKILVPSLSVLETRTVYFTWPYAVNNIARVEIIPRFNPFTSQTQ